MSLENAPRWGVVGAQGDRHGSMEDLLEKPRMLRVLFALAKREPLIFRQFMEASGHGRPYAVELREEMERLGYIAIRELSGHGNAGILQIRLTPFGRRIAEHLLHIEAVLLEERRRK